MKPDRIFNYGAPVSVSVVEKKTNIYTVDRDEDETEVSLDIQQTEALISALQTAMAELKDAEQYGPCAFGDLNKGDIFTIPFCGGPWIMCACGMAISLSNGGGAPKRRMQTTVTRLRKSEVRL